MRLAHGWAWDPASGYLEYNKISIDSWSGPRPIFPHQKRQTTTATHEIPGEIVWKPFYKKTPLQQLTEEKSR